MQLLSLYVGKKAGELGGLEIAGFCLTPTLSTGLEKLLKPGISESRNSPIYLVSSYFSPLYLLTSQPKWREIFSFLFEISYKVWTLNSS